jgi:hypothetical protein
VRWAVRTEHHVLLDDLEIASVLKVRALAAMPGLFL